MRNPTLWVAYERLAKLAPGLVNPDVIFSEKNETLAKISLTKTPDVSSPGAFFAAPEPVPPELMRKQQPPIQIPSLSAFE